MSLTLFFSGVAVLLLLVLLWLARETRRSGTLRAEGTKLALEELFPLHCQHFPQVLQALSSSDAEYLHFRVSCLTRRRVLAERRAVARKFLAGLREDFQRLDQLGRTIAALSPQVEYAGEAGRLRQLLRFELLYRLIQLRLAFGGISVPALRRLADLVGAHAAELGAAMAQLEERSLQGAGLNA
jgi:hypothetical protein